MDMMPRFGGGTTRLGAHNTELWSTLTLRNDRQVLQTIPIRATPKAEPVAVNCAVTFYQIPVHVYTLRFT